MTQTSWKTPVPPVLYHQTRKSRPHNGGKDFWREGQAKEREQQRCASSPALVTPPGLEEQTGLGGRMTGRQPGPAWICKGHAAQASLLERPAPVHMLRPLSASCELHGRPGSGGPGVRGPRPRAALSLPLQACVVWPREGGTALAMVSKVKVSSSNVAIF